MTVIGTSGALTDAVDLTLTVASATASFTLDISPTTRIAKPNQIVSYDASITGTDGFSQPVSLVVVRLPAGVGAVWSVNPVTPDGSAVVPHGSSILTLSIPSNPPFGRHPLQVVGIADMQLVAKDIELIITYPFRVYLPTVLK